MFCVKVILFTFTDTEAYSKLSQLSKMEYFAKIVNGFQLLALPRLRCVKLQNVLNPISLCICFFPELISMGWKVWCWRIFRSSRSQMFFKIGILKNFAIFTGKKLCRSLFLKQLQAWRPLETFILKLNKDYVLPFIKSRYFNKHLKEIVFEWTWRDTLQISILY